MELVKCPLCGKKVENKKINSYEHGLIGHLNTEHAFKKEGKA